MISLCMIVKNEEENIKNCLAKVASFVDEIIVVDTGSTDDTKRIALEFTDKVYDFKWCNDFAAARDFSVSKAINDWVLVLDADEFVNQFDAENIRAFVNDGKNEKAVGRIERINTLEDGTRSKRYVERINRLFNSKYFNYEGMIHEQIASKDGSLYNALPVEITVEHIGYTRETVAKTDKLKRNMDMLMEAVENNPEDPYFYYQLGKTCYMMKDYTASCAYFEKALTFQLDSKLEYVEDLIETYGYALINSERYLDALKIESYSGCYRNSTDFNFLLGLIYMNNAKFPKAVESFLECTKLPNGRMEGITTFLPYYNVGVIYEVLGHKEQAVEYYKLCGEYGQAKERLNQLTK